MGCHGRIMGMSWVRHGFEKTRFFFDTRGFARIIMGCHGIIMGCHGFVMGSSRVIGPPNHQPDIFGINYVNFLFFDITFQKLSIYFRVQDLENCWKTNGPSISFIRSFSESQLGTQEESRVYDCLSSNQRLHQTLQNSTHNLPLAMVPPWLSKLVAAPWVAQVGPLPWTS